MSLQADQLGCSRGERHLFKALSFTVAPGEALRVAGSNGSGKTSLLRLLCGLSSPADGQVLWQGQPLRAARASLGASLIYLGHANGVKDDLLAWENVVVASTLAGQPVTRDDACDALERLGLGAAADLPTRVLSQGQRKRVALARLQPNSAQTLWILDEPFTALDQKAVAVLCATLDAHLARGGMLVYTTHQDVQLSGQRLLDLDAHRELPC